MERFDYELTILNGCRKYFYDSYKTPESVQNFFYLVPSILKVHRKLVKVSHDGFELCKGEMEKKITWENYTVPKLTKVNISDLAEAVSFYRTELLLKSNDAPKNPDFGNYLETLKNNILGKITLL